MKKDVLVSISGKHMGLEPGEMLHAGEEEPEIIEMVMPASYYLRGGKHYILYDEVVEGMQGTIKNRIKISGEDCVEIMKSGLSNSHMVFEKNKKNHSYYRTPYGQLLVSVNTRNMKVCVKDDKIDVQVDYELDVNHEPLADCRIRMNIVPRGSAEFSVMN